MSAVPVIDIAPSFSSNEKARRVVAREIGAACQSIGFLMITGHGVPQSLIDDADGNSRAFFDLDLETKLRTGTGEPMTRRRGYRQMGSTGLAGSRGDVTPHDLREQFIAGPAAVPGDPYYDRPGAMRYFPANAWPERPAAFAEAWTRYYAAMTGLATHMMRLFALALDLPERYFDDKVDRHITQLVSVNYPEQMAEPLAGQLRAGAHTDFGSLTLLATDGSPGGLQVMTPDGTWQDVMPVRDAFIVNIGDLMAQWTNDRWRSTYHRVVNPPRALAESSRRHSLVFFHQPNHDTLVECLPTCLAQGQRASYAPVTSGDHLLSKLAAIRHNTTPRQPVTA